MDFSRVTHTCLLRTRGGVESLWVSVLRSPKSFTPVCKCPDSRTRKFTGEWIMGDTNGWQQGPQDMTDREGEEDLWFPGQWWQTGNAEYGDRVRSPASSQVIEEGKTDVNSFSHCAPSLRIAETFSRQPIVLLWGWKLVLLIGSLSICIVWVVFKVNRNKSYFLARLKKLRRCISCFWSYIPKYQRNKIITLGHFTTLTFRKITSIVTV
jgi:hypothetical protein